MEFRNVYGRWPCDICGQKWIEHTGQDHTFEPEGLDDPLTEPEINAAVRRSTRERKGPLEPPLPPPQERRRIREAAGLTQEQLGALLFDSWIMSAAHADPLAVGLVHHGRRSWRGRVKPCPSKNAWSLDDRLIRACLR